jgi:NodT family efflux transporter outer membrane factor (OMF) lipoprotein
MPDAMLTRLLLASLLGLGACTAPPQLPNVPTIEPPQAFLAQDAADAGMVLPSQGMPWWRSLGDGQLDQLIDLALANNQDLRAASARMDQARALAALDESSRRPSLNLSPQVSRTRASDHVDAGVRVSSPASGMSSLSVTPDTYNTRWRLPLEASYEPDLWERLSLTTQASTQRLTASEQDLSLVRQSLVASVVSSYHLLGVHQRQLALQLEIRALEERRLQARQARQAAGLTDGSEVASLQVDMASTQIRLRQIQEQVALDRHLLALLCGVQPQASPALDAEGNAPEDRLARLPLLADLPARVLQRRPDVRATQARLDAALSDLGAARAEFLPSLRLTGVTGLESSALSQLLQSGSLIWSLAAQIDLPLFDGGRRDAQFAVARARLDEAARQHEASVLQALREVEDALVSAAAQQARVQQQALAVQAAERLAQSASDRADAGLDTWSHAMDRQQAVLLQRQSLLDAQGQALIARVTLLKVLAHP